MMFSAVTEIKYMSRSLINLSYNNVPEQYMIQADVGVKSEE